MSDNSDCVFAVGLTMGSDAGYEARVSVRLSGDSQERVTSGHPVTLDTGKLRTFLAEQDYPGYAEQLTKDLFGNQQVYGQFVGARFVAARERSRLLVRLNLPPNDSTLQEVAWELLRDPDAQFDLAAVELGKDSRKPLSRYLPPPLPALPTRKSTGRLRSVVLLANPLLENYEAINVEEQRRAVAAVLENDTDVTYLLNGQANQQNLLGEIVDGVDIVYIVCHGQQTLNGPVLYFETIDRKTETVDSARMVQTIVSQGSRYDHFGKLVQFLYGGGVTAQTRRVQNAIVQHQEALARRDESALAAIAEAREQLETILRPVIARTERATDIEGGLFERVERPAAVESRNLQTFRHFAGAIDKRTPTLRAWVQPLWSSVPHPAETLFIYKVCDALGYGLPPVTIASSRGDAAHPLLPALLAEDGPQRLRSITRI